MTEPQGVIDAPIPTPPEQKAEHFRRQTLPLVVWSVAAVAVCGLLFVRSYRHAYVGVAQIQEYEVSSAVNGTIKSVHVRLYDDVKAGDVLATLDDTRVRAMIATAQARVKQLQGQLDAARSEILQGRGTGQATFVTDLRRFQAAEENRRLEALSLRASVASVEIEAERLGLETKRAKELLALGLLSQAEYDAQRLRYEGTQRQLEESRGLLERTETDRNAAEARRADFERQQPLLASSSTLLPLRSAVEVETRALEEIEAQQKALVLRSPVSGQVSLVAGREGQAVVAGEPVVMVSDTSVREIVAYLGETNPAQIEPNATVELRSLSRPTEVADSKVLRVGEGILPLPQRLWRDPRVPVYGRTVVIAATPSMPFAPGELLQVRFR
jgi:multidrug resistance efflux pump